ncbi:MAG: adenylate/guanylate cyclase domain-containing protein [Anaerolineales bacterium]|nr:adenylate/guanylate cyclase domain-containing protein [Anaerolineales bacterium]
MAEIPEPTQGTYRKLSRLGYVSNSLGGLVTFLYLAAINPVPAGEGSVRSLAAADIATFIIALAFASITASLLSRRIWKPVMNWENLLDAGAPASEIPEIVARRVLNWPLISAAVIGCAWLFMAIFFSVFYRDPGNFIGIAIGGGVTTAIAYSGTDLLWRRVIPKFFPQGNLSEVPALRMWVRRRLLIGFVVIGAITPVLLVAVTLERMRALQTAASPEAVLDNLVIGLLFILAAGLATGIVVAVLVARAIVEPIQTLRQAMGQVEAGELGTRVQVTTNDELGFLGERFNQMTNGLSQGERLRQLFGLYVSPEVARAAVESGVGLGGELIHCTVMFSDIRDFTSLTEQLPPDSLVDLVNRYMAVMVSVIVENGGMVTRFGGDSILAVFGSPLNPMDDHADRAVAAGTKMRQALKAFNQTEANFTRTPIENGVGIATGPVIAGNVGGKERIEYTVMGDAANLAARLEEMTKEAGFPILFSEGTYHKLSKDPDTGARPLTGIQIRGKQEPVTVYALPG